MRPWLGLIAAALVAASVLMVLRRDSGPSADELLRDSLHVLRATADSCLDAVERENATLDAHRARLDSAEDRVRGLEDPELGGVPADSYAVYLEAFRGYNDSVAAWSAHADSLRVRDARCRAIAEAHNRITDSLSRSMFDGS